MLLGRYVDHHVRPRIASSSCLMQNIVKGAKTYAREPFLLVPHAFFLRHRPSKLAHSTDDGRDAALVRAGFEKQFGNIFRLAVTHPRGYCEVVERFFRNFLTGVFDVPVCERGDAGGEQDRGLSGGLG